jgi:hypothetical protein
LPTANSKPSLLKFPAKQLRARVIARHVYAAGYPGIVVFTCGNAATALRRATNASVLEIGPKGELSPNRWYTPAEIHKTWPYLFDATSGHLPIPLMVEIAGEFKQYLGELSGLQLVPTGSGETILCLSLAYPDVPFVAVYDNSKPPTTRDPHSPLNPIIDALFAVEYWNGLLDV